MQHKSFYFLLLFFSASFMPDARCNTTELLASADSLFEQKKYTESFEIYEKILEQDQQATPRMLLKMAFIKEGLGDYSNALYYLNVYYLKTSDKQARSKMKDIAEEHNLTGFVINDSDFFLNLLNKFQLPVVLSTFLIALLLLGYIFYRKLKTGTKPIVSAILLPVVLVTVFYIANYTDNHNQAIVIENYSYLMSGPSSGSDLVEVIEKGHRVKTYKEHGLWLEIQWNGEKAYIKKDKVKKLG